MKTLVLKILLCSLLLALAMKGNALAQGSARTLRLTILLDYADTAKAAVELDGTVQGDKNRPDLGAWGITETRAPWYDTESELWYVHGTLQRARLTPPDASGYYHLATGPITLAPGDALILLIPFVNMDYQHITPPPTESPLESPLVTQLDAPPGLIGLKYHVDSAQVLELDIPFVPFSKQITLSLTPLFGEMLLGRAGSFRLSGQVIFDGLRPYAEFRQHCQNDPVSPFYRYRVADLLFALDSPPVLNSSFLSRIYQFKPVATVVRAELTACTFDSNRGRVEATFSGRAIASSSSAQFPPDWLKADTAEIHRQVKIPGGRQYEVQLGNITLAPGDSLTVTVPMAQLRDVKPGPARMNYSQGHTAEIVYRGPLNAPLQIVYQPEPGLILGQLPTMARAMTRPAEAALGRFNDSRGAQLTWGVLLAGMAVLAIEFQLRHSRLKAILGGLGWVLAAIALLYGLRGVFGLLALAVLIYLRTTRDPGRQSSVWASGLAGLVLILAAMALDGRAENLFAVLTTLELETTPLTPLIMFVLGLTLAVLLLRAPRAQPEAVAPNANLAMIIALVVLSTFDVLQKSLLGLVALIMGVAYMALAQRKFLSTEEIGRRLRLAWHSRIIPAGVILMILFASQNGLQSTTAVIGSSLGLLSPLIVPMLVFLSIAQSLIAIGLLFIVVYPILPFKAGYLRAVTFGGFLMLIFVVGTASDDRLVTVLNTLIAGRLVYYLSVPLLIGVYFDFDRFNREEQARQMARGQTRELATLKETVPVYLKQLQGLVGTVGSIASLVAPGAWAFFAGAPLVTTYFDILDKLLKLTLPL
jgi:hypothetical protein